MSTDAIDAIAALSEPLRQRLYDVVAAASAAVSRDEAAAAAGISRSLAAFHLDRMAEEGLLTVEYRRLSGRSGRGAGRPNKLYRRAEREFRVELPAREYALAADLMAQAIQGLGGPAIAALDRAAHDRGLELGTRARTDHAERADGPAAACAALASLGYEPVLAADGGVRLRNCPFHQLASAHRTATCGMNLAMLDGVLTGMGAAGARAVLDPEDGFCCVRIVPTGTR